MARVTVKKAARLLRVAEATIRRRIHRGELVGVQVPSPHAMKWFVELPDDASSNQHDASEKDPTKLKVLRASSRSYKPE